MLHAHDSMLARRERLERALGELAEASPWAGTINRLRRLRGIDTLSAVGLQAEIGDRASTRGRLRRVRREARQPERSKIETPAPERGSRVAWRRSFGRRIGSIPTTVCAGRQ